MRLLAIVAMVGLLGLSSLFLGVARAEDPVHFSDPTLKAAVEAELWVTDPTPSDMVGLVSLYVGDRQITSLTGLEYATNLCTLRVPCNWITDLSPLSGLVSLQTLVINNNMLGSLSELSGLYDLRYIDAHDSLITSVSGLQGLDKLETVILRGNKISNISAFSSLTSLKELILLDNQISDISPLVGLTSLQHLDLRGNPLSEEAYDTCIPAIKAANPGVYIQHDRGPFRLMISSTAGGSVIQPGEGEFVSNDGQPVCIEAKADPGFVFVGFSGSYSSESNPLIFTPGQDHQIRAMFVSVLAVLHVNDDAPSDPSPNNLRISDSQENGTPEHPFDSIQEAIEVAGKGATILVHAGTYRETISLLGKCVELTGFDPNDPNAPAWPVIDGGNSSPVVSFTRGSDHSCVLTGFVITGGSGRATGAIRCMASSPTIANCLIVGNRATDWNGAAILCTDSNAVFVNCTITDNRGGQFGAGLSAVNGQVTVANSILWGNWPKEINYEGALLPSVRYCTVAGGGWLAQGNISDDPLFVSHGRWVDSKNPNLAVRADDPGAIWTMGDYHLQSQAGRWDSDIGTWVRDPVTSPSIDAGDPETPIGEEPSPNGGRINLGVYGGTSQASMSSSGG